MIRPLLLGLLIPCALGAQRPVLTLTPHIDVLHTGSFYEGPIVTGAYGGFFGTPTLFTEGQVRLRTTRAWGARLTARLPQSRWALELDAATAEPRVTSSGSTPLPGTTMTGASFGLSGLTARLSTFSLGAARELRPVRGARLTGRLAGSIASTTFALRRFVVAGPSSGYLGYWSPSETASWSRRYVSPGGEAGLGIDFPFRRLFAVSAAVTVGAVRNETGDFATNRMSEISPAVERKESYLMPYSRFTLGLGVTR